MQPEAGSSKRSKRKTAETVVLKGILVLVAHGGAVGEATAAVAAAAMAVLSAVINLSILQYMAP